MACVSPPELDEFQISQFLDGEASDEIARHLDRCPHCRVRARRQAEAQKRVAALLFRVACPTPETLRDYQFNMLPRVEANGVKQHLAECPHCLREYVILEDYLADMAPVAEPGVLERIRTLVARLQESGPKRLSPAYGLRGFEDGILSYRAGEILVNLFVEADREPPAKMLGGLISGVETQGWQANLWQGEEWVATTPVDASGDFEIPHLRSGSYTLFLNGADLLIRIPEISL